MMTKREYEDLHRTALDMLGHTIRVGDTVIAQFYGRTIDIYKVQKVCSKRIKVVVLSSKWEEYKSPSKVIKIKEDGIPED